MRPPRRTGGASKAKGSGVSAPASRCVCAVGAGSGRWMRGGFVFPLGGAGSFKGEALALLP
eukprot:3151988-Prymnesium_polylepis.1